MRAFTSAPSPTRRFTAVTFPDDAASMSALDSVNNVVAAVLSRDVWARTRREVTERASLRAPAYAGSHDPLAALVFCQPSRVDYAIVAGRVLVSEGRLTGTDLETLVERHTRCAQALLS